MRSYRQPTWHLPPPYPHGKPRHGRLLRRGLFGIDPALEELHGENEACLIARARARLLLTLADCSATLPSESAEGETEGGGDGGEHGGGGADVLRRVRDAADCILGEVLQVTRYPPLRGYLVIG